MNKAPCSGRRRAVGSHLVAVAKVAGVAQSGHYVLVLVEHRVDGGTPNGGLLGRQRAPDVLNAVGRGKHTGHVDVARLAAG